MQTDISTFQSLVITVCTSSFNIPKFYTLLTAYLFCTYPKTNCAFCRIQHSM